MNTAIDTGLRGIAVSDAMHTGVLSCPPEAPLRTAARMMVRYGIHAVVVYSEDADADDAIGLWGVVSDEDLVAAAAVDDLDGRTAGVTARTPLVLVHPQESLQRAAELMQEHRVTHLLVVSAESERPVGVVSTLDVARAIAAQPSRAA
jgi:CBS domain-containing protein